MSELLMSFSRRPNTRTAAGRELWPRGGVLFRPQDSWSPEQVPRVWATWVPLAAVPCDGCMTSGSPRVSGDRTHVPNLNSSLSPPWEAGGLTAVSEMEMSGPTGVSRIGRATGSVLGEQRR